MLRSFLKQTLNVCEKRTGVVSTDFVETLPVLMNPALGGGPEAEDNGAILQALAGFLRINGTKALIFPSARSDVLAEIRNGRLRQWRGWRLVDYGEAPSPIIASLDRSLNGLPGNVPKGSYRPIRGKYGVQGEFRSQRNCRLG